MKTSYTRHCQYTSSFINAKHVSLVRCVSFIACIDCWMFWVLKRTQNDEIFCLQSWLVKVSMRWLLDHVLTLYNLVSIADPIASISINFLRCVWRLVANWKVQVLTCRFFLNAFTFKIKLSSRKFKVDASYFTSTLEFEVRCHRVASLKKKLNCATSQDPNHCITERRRLLRRHWSAPWSFNLSSPPLLFLKKFRIVASRVCIHCNEKIN